MFEQTLSPETPTRGRARKSRFLPAALAVHGAALLAVLGASLWSVEEPPEPPVPITWVSTAARAPAPSGRAAEAPRRSAARGAPRSVVAPAVIPDRLPVAASLPEPTAALDESGDGEPGPPLNADGPGGGGPGVEGGWGPPGTDTTGLRNGILVPGGDVHAPVLLRRVEPVYPEGARKARLEGDVVLEAIITSQGEIEELRVVKSAGPLLDASAEAASGAGDTAPRL
jgi:protein TonB